MNQNKLQFGFPGEKKSNSIQTNQLILIDSVFFSCKFELSQPMNIYTAHG